MKKIAKQFALFVLVMFGLQASAQTCAFMQVGGVIEEAALVSGPIVSRLYL